MAFKARVKAAGRRVKRTVGRARQRVSGALKSKSNRRKVLRGAAYTGAAVLGSALPPAGYAAYRLAKNRLSSPEERKAYRAKRSARRKSVVRGAARLATAPIRGAVRAGRALRRGSWGAVKGAAKVGRGIRRVATGYHARKLGKKARKWAGLKK